MHADVRGGRMEMSLLIKIFIVAAVLMTGALSLASVSYAQMDNRPYSFKNSPGGLGMSDGGRQAIINQKILDKTPDNLLRGPDGLLLDVIKGPGNVVIVRREDNGGFVPGYRGTDFRGGNLQMQTGAFNPFFSPSNESRSYSAYQDYQTAAIIGAWISSVTPVLSYDPANTVTSWTVFVYNMN